MNTNTSPKKIDWKQRYEKLAEAVSILSETAEWKGNYSYSVPRSEAWDYLEACARHYASPHPVKKLPLPVIAE